MFNPIVHVDIAEIDRVLIVVAREELGHEFWHEIAERGRKVVRVPNGIAQFAVRDVFTVAREDAYRTTRES